MSDRETIAAYDREVETYADMTADLAPGASLKKFVGLLPPESHVLDLGCGPANASAYMRGRGFRVDPVDASAEMVRIANETHQIGARQAEFGEITGDKVYDGVWANFSLLHASREAFPGHLSAIHTALCPGGAFHIGMKLGEGAERDRLGRFYTFYSEPELLELLEAQDFEVLETKKGREKGLAGTVEPWIVLLCRRR